MKGGHVRSGPAPDPNALRRERDGGEWIHLPASGRPEPAPEWPLTRCSPRERILWTRIWARPQAIVWDELGLANEVAMHVRSMAAAERPRATVASRTLVRQQMDSLGLTVSGLARNRWVIDGAEAAPAATTPADERGSARERLKLVVGE